MHGLATALTCERMLTLCVSMNRIVVMPLLAAACLLCSDAAVADISKWVDARGRVSYGDRPPSDVDATPVPIQPNLRETERVRLTVTDIPSGQADSRTDNDAAASRPDLRAYAEHCRKNRGVNCDLEARQMIDGPAPVIFPGDPAVFPRPDIKPRPTGLSLKFGFTR